MENFVVCIVFPVEASKGQEILGDVQKNDIFTNFGCF